MTDVRGRDRRLLAALAGLGLVALGMASGGGAGAHAADAAGQPAGAPPATVGGTAPQTTTATEPRRRPRTRLTALPPRERRSGTEALRVKLSGPLAPGSPRPRLSPAVPGSWRSVGDAEYFRPASTLAPCADYVLSIPAGTRARGERPLGKGRRVDLQVVCPPLQALQQALSRLGYLPYRLRSHAAQGAGDRESRRLAARLAFAPPAGRLVAHVPDAPPLAYGQLDAATRGALEVFEDDHHIPLGSPDERVWKSLFAAETHGWRDPRPYTFVTVTESDPETLRVHMGNHVVLSSPTNTGVAGAETELGVFPIFARYTATTMVGTNPDGAHYDDPGVPWVNYFNGGDAVHGFVRPSYGTPQSNGCVELPVSTAKTVYGMLALGDIVIVER
jgi:hypothetical protein